MLVPREIASCGDTVNSPTPSDSHCQLSCDPARDIEKLSFDTAFLTATYNSDSWIGAAKYRFYGDAYPFDYTDKIGDIAFAEYALPATPLRPDYRSHSSPGCYSDAPAQHWPP